jgi:hypothetical protein
MRAFAFACVYCASLTPEEAPWHSRRMKLDVPPYFTYRVYRFGTRHISGQ